MLSIVIPTYGMHGQGVFFLERCIQSIAKQRLPADSVLEIVITDQSEDAVIQEWALAHKVIGPHAISLRYHRVHSKRGFAAHNLNVGISHAHYDYCKILFQDDLLVESDYIARILQLIHAHSPQCIITGACHTEDGLEFFNPITPIENPYFLFGNNTVSSPSVLTINRVFARAHPFDENLKMLFDCAFYYEIFSTNQSMMFAPEIHIANGIWEGQAQHGIEPSQFTNEVRHLHRKYPQAQLSKLLPDYQGLFAQRHPNAPFPFSTTLEPNLLTHIKEWWAQYRQSLKRK
jgi:glycosyltransferase involved in cell wall biosynthesis